MIPAEAGLLALQAASNATRKYMILFQLPDISKLHRRLSKRISKGISLLREILFGSIRTVLYFCNNAIVAFTRFTENMTPFLQITVLGLCLDFDMHKLTCTGKMTSRTNCLYRGTLP